LYLLSFLQFYHHFFFDLLQVTSCKTLNTANGKYILGGNIKATTSPCFTIKGSDVELHGNSYVITDSTGGTLVGVSMEGKGQYLHDIGISSFSVGVDIYPPIFLI
jgi:hypothetical protein